MNATSSFDTIIIGGGIVGLSTADALQRRGQRVLLLEQFAPSHDRGSSHGDGRIIRFAYSDAIYVEMAHLAFAAWDQLAERAGRPMYHVTGGLDLGPESSAELRQLAQNFERFDLSYERLTPAECARRFPHFQLPDGSVAIYQPGAGVVFADHAIRALWALLTESDAVLHPHMAVTELSPTARGVRVQTKDGQAWEAEEVVVAAGSWARPLLAQSGLSLPLQVTQEQVSYFPAPATPDHTLRGMPIFIDYHDDDVFYGLPQIEISGVKVAGHHIGQPSDPDRPLPLDAANTATVTDFVKRRLPYLTPIPSHQVRCLYTSTPDHDFILDRHPDAPQIIIGAGFSGHGFKFGPLLGELLADLALQERTAVALERFALSRFEDMQFIQEIL